MTSALRAYADYLQSLTPESLDRLETFVTDDVRFIDPFNDVTGAASMRRVFEDMFSALGDVGFNVEQVFGDGDSGMLHWQFRARLRGKPWRFYGSSLVRFAEDGRVCYHRDDWDTGRNFYEKLPVIGWFLRRIRLRLKVD
ncbi:MAG: nuclear transport factor 2 family protein [Alphaproteobacteria bacterium]